jgi:hypothetical protein
MFIARQVASIILACAAVGCGFDHVVTEFDSTSTSSLEGGGAQFGASINGVMWYWAVTWNDVKDTPDWSPGDTPTISMPKAIELAQSEMGKYADTPSAYQLDGVEWLPISNCCNPTDTRKWIYVVNFERKERFENGSRGTIRIPVLLDGRRIEGKQESPRP